MRFRHCISIALFCAVSLAQTSHPHIFVTGEPVAGLRSVDDVRQAITSGRGAVLWEELVAKVDAEAAEEAWTPHSMTPGRSEAAATMGNRDYGIVSATVNRIMDAALVVLIKDDRRYAEASLKQIDALFDADRWPDWEDMAHINAGRRADLRHGQLVLGVALAYDWMYGLLTPEERTRILEGIDRCAIQRYKAGVDAKEWWANGSNNWMTVMVGGFGIAGMALGGDLPSAEWLAPYAEPRMEGYLDFLGREGEFNESVQYAGSMMGVVRYFMARRYASHGADNPFERHNLGDFCRWYMQMTFPPGRVAGFGDPSADMPPVVSYFAAVAAAMDNPVFQWFYLQYAGQMLDSHRLRALELLYYDASLEPKSPEGVLPLGRAYHDQGKLISSRSSWDPRSTPSVVYAKAGRESSHGHADWGQVCIDGYGERLLIDLGAPPGYPKDHAEMYYNYQQLGHNVFVFGHNDTGGVSLRESKRQGSIPYSEFDPGRGGAWTMDLTPIYDNALDVTRTVVHLLPRAVVVFDEARLKAEQPISMRWHTIGEPEWNEDGHFSVTRESARLSAYTTRLDGPADIVLGHHAYEEPYDKDRLGTPYPQRNEPFVELTAHDTHCRILSIFVTGTSADSPSEISPQDGGWKATTQEGEIWVNVEEGSLTVQRQGGGPTWAVSLPEPTRQ